MANVAISGLPAAAAVGGEVFVGNQSGTTKKITLNTSVLSDYEEGSWTPVIEGTTTTGTNTYSTQSGSYTVEGNRVIVDFHITLTNLASVGLLEITGLPFVASGTNHTTSVLFVEGFNAFSNTPAFFGITVNATDGINLYNQVPANMSRFNDTEATNSLSIRGSLTYKIS